LQRVGIGGVSSMFNLTLASTLELTHLS
jgi:hypothetical protein